MVFVLAICVIVNLGVTIASASTSGVESKSSTEIIYDMSACLTDVKYIPYVNYNVVTRGASKPSSDKTWSLGSSYDFNGSTRSQTCYTNYWFIDHNSNMHLSIKETNGGSGTYTVKVITYGWLADSTEYTYTLDKGKSYGMDFGNAIESDDKVLLSFQGSYIAFNGTISRN